MEKQVHKIASRCIVDGKWIKDSYEVTIDGKKHDFRDLAKAFGIHIPNQPNAPTKPNKKEKINIDIEENSYGDMEQAFDTGSAEEHGDGDSKSTE